MSLCQIYFVWLFSWRTFHTNVNVNVDGHRAHMIVWRKPNHFIIGYVVQMFF